MGKYIFKLLIGLISILFLSSFEKESNISTVRISQITSEELQYKSSTTFKYNNRGLLIKNFDEKGGYSTYEYDSLKRIVRLNSYDERGLCFYYTYEYNLNSISTMNFMLYPFSTTTWSGGKEKQTYIYNSNNHCERIEYYTKHENENWLKSEYFTLCFWTNDNLTMIKHFNGDKLEYTETYQYDSKNNPQKLLNYLIYPEYTSKCNPITRTKKFQDGREVQTTYNYIYNDLDYPIQIDRIDMIGVHKEFYKYE